MRIIPEPQRYTPEDHPEFEVSLVYLVGVRLSRNLYQDQDTNKMNKELTNIV